MCPSTKMRTKPNCKNWPPPRASRKWCVRWKRIWISRFIRRISMKLAFMTLGCPNWDLDTICTRGREYGFDGVDFRGYLDEIDITKLPLFTTQAAGTLRQLNDAGLEVSGVSTSIKVCDAGARAANLDE